MSHASFVFAGYIATFGLVIGHAVRTIRRGRRVAPLVAPEDRRWS